jgi:2-keto-4-pentenoate hydratase/2-oxohepta-3-ene-1,7-dioic acid hydratase in catechol pathway
MKLGRVTTPQGDLVEVSFIDGRAVNGKQSWAVEDVRFECPVQPGKLIYVGMNYRAHANELGAPIPEDPILFFKPSTSVIGHGAAIVLPSGVGRIEYEGELAVAIGNRARNVKESEALSVVAGYTIANDVTARELQRPGSQWTAAKAWDTFAPVGPWIETELAADDVRVRTFVNGDVKQDTSTSDLLFGIPELIAYASRIMTLEPGDVIATGTPAGVGPLEAGDTVRVAIDGIGTLENVTVADPNGEPGVSE